MDVVVGDAEMLGLLCGHGVLWSYSSEGLAKKAGREKAGGWIKRIEGAGARS